MFPTAFGAGGCPPPPPYDVAVQQQPLPQHCLQQQSLPGPSTSHHQPTSSQQLSTILDRTVQVDDFATAFLQYMEGANVPASSSGPIPSSANAASFIVPLNYGAHPQQAMDLMVAPPAASNGPFRTVAVSVDECTSNQWLETFRHLHISHLGGSDLFQQHWPEYAGIEHAFVEKRNRYINAKAVLAESLAPHVPNPAWRAVCKGARIEFIKSVQRLDRFIWLIRHHPLELRAMLNEQKTFNEIFRELTLPSGSGVDALRNDLYDWEEEHGSSLLDLSIFFHKRLVTDCSVEYRCLFDECNAVFVRSKAKRHRANGKARFAMQTHLNACHSEHLTRHTMSAQHDPKADSSALLASTLPLPGGSQSAIEYSSHPLQNASSSIQNRLTCPPIPSVHTAHDSAALQSHHVVNPFAAAMSHIPQTYLARVQQPTAPVAQPYAVAHHSYSVQPPTAPVAQPYSAAQHSNPITSTTSVDGSALRHQASWHSFINEHLQTYPSAVQPHRQAYPSAVQPHPQPYPSAAQPHPQPYPSVVKPYPQPYPSAVHPPVPDGRSYVVQSAAVPSTQAVSVTQQRLLQPFATFRRDSTAIAESRPGPLMAHTCDGQSTLLRGGGSRIYQTVSGAHYSGIREPQVAVDARPAAYQAQPTTFRPLVHHQQPVVMTHDQRLQASGCSTYPFMAVQSSSHSPGMPPASKSLPERFPILHRSLSGQAVTSRPGPPTSRTVEEVVTISDDDDEAVVVVANATSEDSSARSIYATARTSNVEANTETEDVTIIDCSTHSDSATAGPKDPVPANGGTPKSRSYPLTYKRNASGLVKCDFCRNIYRTELGVRCHYNSSHRKQREGRTATRMPIDSPRKRLQVSTCPAVMALPLRSSPRSLELRREWPEYAELLDDFNDKWKRYVGYQSELSSKGVAMSPSSSTGVRLEEYFKEYRAAKWAVEKFELLTENCPRELRKLLDMGMRFEDACEDLLATAAKRTTADETTASEEEVGSGSGAQNTSAEASSEQSDGRCSSPTDRLASAIVAAVKKEEPPEEAPPVPAEASGMIETTSDLAHAKKSAPAVITPRHEPGRSEFYASSATTVIDGSDNQTATIDDELPTSQRGRPLKLRPWLTPKKTARKATISAKNTSKPLVTSRPITLPTFYHTGWESFAQLKHLRLQLQSVALKGSTEAESDVHLQVACIRALIRHSREPLHDLLREGRTVDEIIASLESKLPFALLRKIRERRLNRIQELEERLKDHDLMPTDFQQFFEPEGDTFYCLFNDCDATFEKTASSEDLNEAMRRHCETEHFALRH